jgi:hypothetical protein
VATLSLVALATAAVATARLWRWWRAQPRDPADGEGGPPAGRLRFVALVAAVLGTLCTYGVLLAATATFLRGCP